MQRIAMLLICAALWNPQAAKATTCETVGDLVGGFVGGASSYGLIQAIGSAGSWVSAGLYGAGVAAAATVGDDAAEAVCENFRQILETTAQVYCMAGEYICESVATARTSLVRDFQICPTCWPDEIFGAYLMDDLSRERYLREMQWRRAGSLGNEVYVLPRDQLGEFSSSLVDAYFAGLLTGYSIEDSVQMNSMLK
jgi:hypothetical protein